MDPRPVATIKACTLALVALAGCTTSPPGLREGRIPPAQNYDVRIQPARIPPNPQGAFALSSATGCDVIYVAKAGAADTVTYAMRPTSRIPDQQQCVERLQGQPGVEAVSPVS